MRDDGGGPAWRLTTLAGDLAVAAAALYLAFWLRIEFPLPGVRELLPADRITFFHEAWPWALLSQPAVLFLFGLYENRLKLPRLELARWVSLAVVAQILALATLIFLGNRPFPRTVLLLYALLDGAGLFLWRALAQTWPRIELRRVVLVGCGPAALEVAEKIRQHHLHGLRVHGYLPAPGQVPPAGDDAVLGERLPDLAALQRLLAAGEVDDVILAPDADSWQTQLLGEIAGGRVARAGILLLPGPFESLIGRLRYRWINDLPLIEVLRESEWRRAMPVKRTFDLAGSLLLLVVTAPLMAGCACAVRLTSRGPVFLRQERVGRGFRSFRVIKFRTMRDDAERDTGEVLALRNDPRLTPVGGFLRRFRLDELPQLFNVLRGEMSLVGPRPERPGFVRQNLAEVPGYAERFAVPPGLTGLAQVNGEYHSTPENKLRYDLAYIANRSLWLDLSILVRTVRTVLTSQGV